MSYEISMRSCGKKNGNFLMKLLSKTLGSKCYEEMGFTILSTTCAQNYEYFKIKIKRKKKNIFSEIFECSVRFYYKSKACISAIHMSNLESFCLLWR